MASIVLGYEYDIFISYRHNDNLDGWVTDFVQNLEKELRSTLKDTVTIYFDRNPNDGLLETHNVDKSLEGKLKCLIFIPILSQTYCDTKSFAWQHEFCAFNKLLKEDEFGRDIKLSHGNVASRILPIKIHDLDHEDKSIIENEIGGVLRSIEFIFKSSGVNRPLRSQEDHPQDNLNKTFYRDQINKVANAIKEITLGIKSQSQSSSTKIIVGINNPKRNIKSYLTIASLGILILAIIGYFLIPTWLSSKVEDTSLEKSIAVLPFVNMSNDPEQEYFSDGISEELINALAKMTNLKVAGRTSSFSFKNKHEDLRKVGESLGVNTILEGSVRKSGNTVRITAQLINVEDGFHLWTQTFDRELSDIFKVQDEITAAIIEELKVHLNEKEIAPTKPVDIAAYTIYLKARQKLAKRGIYNLIEAKDLFYQSLELDSSYSPTYSGLSKTLCLMNNYSQGDNRFRKTHEEALVYAKKALEIDPHNAEAYMTTGIAKSWYVWDWESAEKDIKKSIELNPNDAETNNFAGDFYRIVADFEKSEAYEAKALELDPLHAVNHWDLAKILLDQGRLEEAKRYFRSCFQLDREFLSLIYPGFAMSFQSDPFMNEIDSIFKTLDVHNHPESIILHMKTVIAVGKGEMDKAKEYIQELEILIGKGFTSSAYLLDYSYIMGDMEKAQYWASRAVKAKDGLLIYESLKQLPEMYEDENIRKALTSPELDALYEIRRKNLRLK